MMNIESTKDQRVWHSGPPPFIGWWNASSVQTKVLWRWWNGECWSSYALEGDSFSTVYNVSQTVELSTGIMWNDYWPENAVCPRFDPNGSLVAMWRGRVWEWVDGELVNRTEEFRNIFESMPSLKDIAGPDYKFVDTKALEDELDAIEHRLGRVRKVLRGE